MNIGIIGTSRITHDHIKVLKKLGHNIEFLSSTRKKSLNLKRLSLKHKIKKLFLTGASLLSSKKIKNCNFLITARIQDNLKILKSCIKLNRYIFIEKPVFLKKESFKNFLKFEKNICWL